MSSRSIYELRSNALQSAAAALPPTALATVISICDSPAYTRAIQGQPQQSDADGLGCARGIRAAFLLEGGMALLLYGIWHFWHLIH